MKNTGGNKHPSPVSVGVYTLYPAARSIGAKKRQHHPPCPVPCTRTKVVVIAPALMLGG